MAEKYATAEVKQEGEFSLKGKKTKPKKLVDSSKQDPVKVDLTKPEAQGELVEDITKVDLTEKKEDDAEDMLRRVIMNKLSDKIKEENDNNSTTLRGVLDTLNKVEKISDEYLGVNEEVKIVEDKEYKSFKGASSIVIDCRPPNM